MCRGASVSQSNNACAYLEVTSYCGAGLSRDFADAGCARAHLWAGHEAGAEGQASPPGLCHVGHPAHIPTGMPELQFCAALSPYLPFEREGGGGGLLSPPP